MKLFTAIVALAGMSTATASLRGGAVLPSDMKDLLNKLVAADEGVADQSTCTAVKFQTCQIGGTHFGCAPHTTCNFVGPNNVSNNPGATTKGHYCQQNTLEDELMEESQYLQDASDDCRVLGPENGGCTPIEFPGLSCKEGYTCEGYEQTTGVQDATLGTCVPVTDRSGEEEPSDTLVCNHRFYDQQFPCTTIADCDEKNPRNCEAVCARGVCAAPTFEDEVEELAASDDDLPLDERHCLVTTQDEQPRCSFVNGKQVPTTGKVCCSMTVETDGSKKYSHNDVTCDWFGDNPNNVNNSDSGAGYYCRLNVGEDVAVN